MYPVGTTFVRVVISLSTNGSAVSGCSVWRVGRANGSRYAYLAARGEPCFALVKSSRHNWMSRGSPRAVAYRCPLQGEMAGTTQGGNPSSGSVINR